MLDRIEDYIRNGREDEVENAIKGRLSWNTLRNWLRDKPKAVRAYKIDSLLQIADLLPPLGDIEMEHVYGFALKELDLDRDSQIALRKYHGVYGIRHNLAGSGASEFDRITVNTSAAPRFSIFWFRYVALGRPARCDGFVLMHRGRLHFLGLSPVAVFFANVDAAPRPDTDLLKGIAVLENLSEDRTGTSNIVLFRREETELNVEEIKIVHEYISSNHRR